MIYKNFDKKAGSREKVTSKAGMSVNEPLVKKLHKPVIKKLKRRKVYTTF